MAVHLQSIEIGRPPGMTKRHKGRDVFDDPVAAFSAGRMGMLLLLVSLGMLFAASILAYAILRVEAAGQLGAAPALPKGLWISTLVLIVSSGTLHTALRAAQRDAQIVLRIAMAVTLALGVIFLISQAFCWQTLIAEHEAVWDRLADLPRYMLASFYVLTALHAAHVIGGLIPMSVVTTRSLTGRYDAKSYAGVYYCGMYWHFLDGVWLALFLTLLLGS